MINEAINQSFLVFIPLFTLFKSFFIFSDSLNPITSWQGCEREVAEAGDADERKSESIMRLSWALVHSRQPEDVQRGIAMLEGT